MNVGRKVTKGMKVIPENSRRPHFAKSPLVSGSSARGSRPEDQIARKAEGGDNVGGWPERGSGWVGSGGSAIKTGSRSSPKEGESLLHPDVCGTILFAVAQIL